jgi:hypothetical protein
MHPFTSKEFIYKKTSAPVIFIDLILKSCWKCQIKFRENEFSFEETLEVSVDTQDRAFEISKICRDILEIKGKGSEKSLWSNCVNFSEDHLNSLREMLKLRKDELTTSANSLDTQFPVSLILNEFGRPFDENVVLNARTVNSSDIHIHSDSDSDSNDSACVTLSYESNESKIEYGVSDSEDIAQRTEEVEIDEMKRNKVWWVFNEPIFKRNKRATDNIRAQITNYIALGFDKMNPKLFSKFLKNVQEQFYWETEYFINPNTGKYYFTYHLDLMWGIFSDEQISMTRIHVENQKVAEPVLWNEEYLVVIAREKKKLRKSDDYM